MPQKIIIYEVLGHQKKKKKKNSCINEVVWNYLLFIHVPVGRWILQQKSSNSQARFSKKIITIETLELNHEL